MNKKKSAIAAGAAVLVVVALATVAYLTTGTSETTSRGADSAPASPTPSPPKDAGTQVDDQHDASAGTPVKSSAMPVESIVASRSDIASTYDQLKQMAESGNGDASYQLYEDLRRCSMIDLRAGAMERMASQSGEAGDALAQASQAIGDDLQACKGITPDQASQYADWLKRAARDGQTQAKSEFYTVLAEFDDPRVAIDRAEELAQLRQEAARHLTDAAARGHQDAIGRLADFYENGGIVSRNLVEAYAYTSLMNELRGGPGWAGNLDRIATQLSAEELERARRRAEQLSRICCG